MGVVGREKAGWLTPSRPRFLIPLMSLPCLPADQPAHVAQAGGQRGLSAAQHSAACMHACTLLHASCLPMDEPLGAHHFILPIVQLSCNNSLHAHTASVNSSVSPEVHLCNGGGLSSGGSLSALPPVRALGRALEAQPGLAQAIDTALPNVPLPAAPVAASLAGQTPCVWPIAPSFTLDPTLLRPCSHLVALQAR